MRYSVVSDLPGRIRVLLGRYVFSEPEGEALAQKLAALPGVTGAKAGYLTGSILLNYTGQVRGEIIAALDALELEPAPAGTKPRVPVSFQSELITLAAGQLVRKLLPAPLRIAATVWSSLKFLRRGGTALLAGHLNVEVLDASAISGAMLLGDFTSASSVMFLLRLSELLEEHTMRRTKAALLGSLRLHTDLVWVLVDDVETQIPLVDVVVGTQVVIRAGSAIPVDGEVISGEALVSEASLTGEPLAVFKQKGASVFAGTVLSEGSLVVKTRVTEGETRLSLIIDIIESAEARRANIQGRAEHIADRLVPYSFLLAAGVFLFTGNLTKTVSVLLVDYSCAVKLATPIAVLSAMREAAEAGVLVKGGRFLEIAATADTFVFDKTGTLTLATPQVAKVTALGDLSREEVLRLAACMEEHFPHSLARAIVKAAKEENLHHEEEHAEVEYVAAHGITTFIHGKRALIGSRHFVFDDEKIPLGEAERLILEAEEGSVVCLAVDGEFAGIISVTDPVRAEAATTIAALYELGVEQVIMLTGDSEAAARKTSELLGVNVYRSGMLPSDKSDYIEELRRAGRVVVMVGDGINDSPALASADASVSMTDASDLAQDVADCVLTGSDIARLAEIRRLGQALLSRISGQYYGIAGFNSGVLFLGLFGLLPPSTCALLHNLFTVYISASATRPLLRRLEGDK
jgi:heavy metal translocating P-type ATPase